MATITNFEDLEIWKEARRLFQKTLLLIKDSDAAKDFKFRDQLKASSGSVMDNIAEGFERDSRLEFINFLSISKASAGEARCQIIRGYDMNYWNEETMTILKNEYQTLSSHIANFIKYLNTSTIKGQKFKDRS